MIFQYQTSIFKLEVAKFVSKKQQVTAPMPLSQGEVTDSILDKYKYLNINIGTYVCELEH